MGMTVYNEDGSVASVFNSIRRRGNTLVLDQLALGSMQMDMIITPEEALKAVRLGFSWGLISFVLFFPFFWLRYRASKKAATQEDTQSGEEAGPTA